MASWKTLLQSLPHLSPREKAKALHALHSLGWADDKINKYLHDALEVGEDTLAYLLLHFIPTTAASSSDMTPKSVTIISEKVDDEDIVLQKHVFRFKNESNFNRYIANGSLTPLKQVQEGCDNLAAITSYEDLEEGACYVNSGMLVSRVKSLQNYIANEARACEDEFSGSMLSELQRNGYAKNPVLRPDLRRHCLGIPKLEQEFDAVILDGSNQAFLGSVKHVLRGTSFISDLITEVNKVACRREDLDTFPSYAEFRGRELGCCIRVDSIQDKASEDVVHCCWRNGIGLFRRSGHALRMVPASPGYTQSIGKGFINLALSRSFFTLSKILR